jgi:hypothetical protein
MCSKASMTRYSSSNYNMRIMKIMILGMKIMVVRRMMMIRIIMMMMKFV